jgi:hypothetical protein
MKSQKARKHRPPNVRRAENCRVDLERERLDGIEHEEDKARVKYKMQSEESVDPKTSSSTTSAGRTA